MNVQKASEILQLQFPVSAAKLKSQYRSLAREYHSDLTGGPDEPFKLLSQAYTYIKNHAADFIDYNGDTPGKVTHTVDGTPLCELGLGLGPTTNGRPCENCQGKGHVPTTQAVKIRCRACDDGLVDLHKAYPKWYRQGVRRPCLICQGLGGYWSSQPGDARLFCTTCKGTGEIKLWNPVLPKGALAALAGKFSKANG